MTASRPSPCAARTCSGQSASWERNPAFAPRATARSIFSRVDDVTYTSAPSAAAIWTANVETPLPAPVTRIARPGPACAQVDDDLAGARDRVGDLLHLERRRVAERDQSCCPHRYSAGISRVACSSGIP